MRSAPQAPSVAGAVLLILGGAAAQSTTVPQQAADVRVNGWSGMGIYATYSPLGGVEGTLMLADPLDGCGDLRTLRGGGTVVVAVLGPGSTCTPMEQAHNAERAGAAAIINVAEGAGEGYIWIMQSTARDDAVRLRQPGIPHLSVSQSSGVALLAAAQEGKDVQIELWDDNAGGNNSTGTHPAYVLACIAIMLSVVVVPLVVLRLLCRQNRVPGPAPAGVVVDSREAVAVHHALRSMPVAAGPGPGADPDATCAVCLAPLGNSDPVRTLPCQHPFHAACVDPWLVQRRTCPLCKDDVTRPRSAVG